MNKIHHINHKEMERYLNQFILKGYIPNTIRAYSLEFAQLFYGLKDCSAPILPPEKLQSYSLYCAKDLKLVYKVCPNGITFKSRLHKNQSVPNKRSPASPKPGTI